MSVRYVGNATHKSKFSNFNAEMRFHNSYYGQSNEIDDAPCISGVHSGEMRVLCVLEGKTLLRNCHALRRPSIAEKRKRAETNRKHP